MTLYKIDYYVFGEKMIKAYTKINAIDEKNSIRIFYDAVRASEGNILNHKIVNIEKS